MIAVDPILSGPATARRSSKAPERQAGGAETLSGRTSMDTGVANAEALRRVAAVQPFLVDVRPAGEIIAGLAPDELLHAGPPLNGWGEACGALRGAVVGTLIHFGRAPNAATAEEMAKKGAVRLTPANDCGALATYAGVISRETMVLVVEDRVSGRRTVAALNEGRGKALRYGSHDAATLTRLKWLEGEFAELLGAALRRANGIDVFHILGQALHMGDDGHSRQKAASALLANALGPFMVEAGHRNIPAALRFLAQNEIFFLPITMAAAKCSMLAGEGVPGSTLVTCFATNGLRFGIKVSGRPDAWWTAPVPIIEGRYFQGYGPDDANPVIGDSEIAECFGLGAFAMSAAPALSQYVGGSPEAATRLAAGMYAITLGEHPRFTIPSLSYRGTPFGVDAQKVVDQNIEPIFNTGIAHRDPGVGQIGAGLGRVPLACFQMALEGLGRTSGHIHGKAKEGREAP